MKRPDRATPGFALAFEDTYNPGQQETKAGSLISEV